MSRILSPGFLIRFVAVAAILGVVGVVGAFVVMWSGAPSFRATTELPAFMQRTIHWAFKQSVYANGGDIDVPPHINLEDEGLIALGANHYAQNCVRCHGAPGLGQNAMVYAMEPRPQHLPSVVDQFEAGDFHYILEHGVMMSAMPAWPTEGRSDEIWATVAFLEAMKDGMTAEAYLDKVRPDPADVPVMPFRAPLRSAEADLPGMGATPWPEEYSTAVPTGGFADYALSGIPVAQCSTCHGIAGDGAPTGGHAPNLTILDADYISATLNAYATGARKSGYMQVVASQLTSDQIDSLAAYFDALPDTSATASLDPDQIARGQEIATLGISDAGTPACASCHAQGTTREGDWSVPALAGQTAPYLEAQLRLFRSGGRGALVTWSPMTMVSHEMDDDDIEAVAAYYASLDPGTEPPMGRGDPRAAGQLVAQVCSECHQDDMAGVPSGEFPNLTLQGAGYILTQLHAFKTDGRVAERMQQTAYRLEADEIAALSQYIDALPPEARDGEPVDGDIALGAQIASEGLPTRDVRACLTCHAPEVTARIAAIPRLQGQYSKYILHRLETLGADRGRLAGTEEIYRQPMHPIAQALSDEEKAALAAYFADQPPVPKDGDSAQN